jgi:hypothetical protein
LIQRSNTMPAPHATYSPATNDTIPITIFRGNLGLVFIALLLSSNFRHERRFLS